MDIGEHEAVERIAIDILQTDAEFLKRIAAYRNVLARQRDVKLKRQWTRKSLIESAIATEARKLREQLEEMMAALGPLPAADDPEGMERYVKRVLAWDKKHNE